MLRKSSFFLLIIVFHYNSAFSSELYGHVTGNSPIIWNNAVPVPSLGGSLRVIGQLKNQERLQSGTQEV